MVGGRFFRRLVPGKRFWKLFLYTLPVTIYPLVFGTLYALLFCYFQDMQYQENIDKFMREVESDRWMDAFSVPGAPGIHDVPIAPFYLPTLLNTNWYKRLNLTKPLEDVGRDSPADRLAVLDGLSQEINPYSGSPTSHWVFVTSLPWIYRPWDAAFDRLVQHHYIHPPARNASLSYVDCTSAGFLCGIWNVQHPAMLHFAVEEPGDDSEPWPVAFSIRGYPLRPITVRIVELGLETFKPGVFPNEFDQLLFLTSGEYSVESLEEYSSGEQQQRRFHDWFTLESKRWPLLDALYKMDGWIHESLGEESPILSVLLTLRKIVFTVAELFVQVPIVFGTKLWWAIGSWYEWYVGTDVPVDPSADWETLMPGNGAGGSFWDEFFMGGIVKVFEEAADSMAKDRDESVSEAAKAAVTSFQSHL